jgi:hypothetical protein
MATSVAAVTVLLSSRALVRVSTTLRDTAPAPLTATPTPDAPKPTAIDAAIDVARIDPSASCQNFVSE